MIIYSVFSSNIHIESINIIKSGLSTYKRYLHSVLAILPIAWFNIHKEYGSVKLS